MKTQKSVYDARFLKKFTLAIIQVVGTQKLNIPPTKEIIDADLVPELSEELLREYALNKEFLKKIKELDDSIETATESKPQQQVYSEPKTTVSTKPKPSLQVKPEMSKRPATRPQQPTIETDSTPGYEKIQPLLKDPSVSRIQCFAPNRPLSIIRTGQKQLTRIALSPIQIKDIFEEIADQAHIPLIEGPFKVALKDLTINGINSMITTPRFIIQKQTAYSLLESKQR